MTLTRIVSVAVVLALVAPVRADDQPTDPYGEPSTAPAQPPAPAPAPAPAPPDIGPAPVPPPPPVPTDPAVALAQANAAATAGDWEAVQRLVAPFLPGTTLGRGDQAEIHRLAGLAAYFGGRMVEAEAELLAYARLELDARLDPSVVPPEAVTYFDDVRARHAAELRALRPRDGRYFVLNLVPPLGQFQNGHRIKGWMLGAGLVALTAAHVTTYFVLDGWCGDDNLCEPGGTNKASTARTLRAINLAAGIGAIALYVYGVVDGVRHYRKRNAQLDLEATSGGGVLLVSGRW